MSDYQYPTAAQLEEIRAWEFIGDMEAVCAKLLAHVKSLWWYEGWHEYTSRDDWGRASRVYDLSTGGWSGNESLIGALRENLLFWSLCWLEHRRGGHYRFAVFEAEPAEGGAASLAKETAFYERNKETIHQHWPSAYIVIRGEAILCGADGYEQALEQGYNRCGTTSFLVQKLEHGACTT